MILTGTCLGVMTNLRRFGLALLCGSFLLGTSFTAQAAGTAEDESPSMQLRLLARAYEHGEGVQRDQTHAAKLYCDAARAGDAEAQYSLGWMLANGRGIPRDDAQAAYFFSLAAGQSHPQAQKMLRFVGEPSRDTPPCMIVKSIPVPPEEKETDDIAAYLASAPPDKKKLVEMLLRLAPEYGVHPQLALAIARTESNLNPAAVSPKNAQGLMQLIPETSARFNVTKPFDPEQNIRGGLSYVRWLLAYFRGKVSLVAAAYNAGEGAVNRYRGVPPYAETQGYVKRIMGQFKRSDHPFDAKVTEPSPELARIRSVGLM